MIIFDLQQVDLPTTSLRIAHHTNISTYFSLLQRAIRSLLIVDGASFAAAASLPTSCVTLQLSAPVVRNVVPKGCGFLGSWGTVGGPLLLVDLTRLLPLAKGLYRGIVRSRGVCYYGSSGSGGGHGAVIGGFGVFLSSYVGLPYKILRRKQVKK